MADFIDLKNMLCLFACFTLLLTSSVDAKYKSSTVQIDLTDGDKLKLFSAKEIAEFDGSDPKKPIYMAIKGAVFDVTAGESFYGKDGPYNALVGKDSSRAVAKMSLDPEDLTSNLDGLSDDFLESLDKVYEGTYKAKYPIVGYMDYLAKMAAPVAHDGGEL